MWIAIRTEDGSWTLRRGSDGPTCHSLSGARTQAFERYVWPCRIGELARTQGRVRVLEIGTGVALNLSAALLEVQRSGGTRLEVITVENSLEVLAAQCPSDATDPEFGRLQAQVRALVHHAAQHGPLTNMCGGVELALDLRVADAPNLAKHLPRGWADALFLDPFAPQVDPKLWEEEFLRALALTLAPHAILSTYSASLEVRARLQRAGLRVGLGPRVGRKVAGTLASPTAELPALDARTERKLSRRVARRRPEGAP